jgi:hypothetical protein
MSYRNLFILLAAMAFVPALGCSSSETVGGTTQKLEARCTDVGVEDEGWLCPAPLPVECEDGGADPEAIFFQPPGQSPSCDGIDLSLDEEDEGPFALGTYDIVIFEGEDEERVAVCSAELTVEDTQDPEANDEPIELWPPNHKFHTIYGEDCVRDACDPDLTVIFDSASSDEPVNDNGDGNTEPDIILECDRVQLRAERQGGGNGRTYRLGWNAIDASGNPATGECVVRVPHDQSGEEVDDEDPPIEEEKVTLDPEECGGDEGGDGEVP